MKLKGKFYKYSKEWFSAEYAISIAETGEEVRVNLTNEIKTVYLFMREQYQGFHANGLSFFQRQEAIAAHCCVSVSTVKRAITSLSKLGLVFVYRISEANKRQNSYRVVDLHMCKNLKLGSDSLYALGIIDSPIILENKEIVQRYKKFDDEPF